MAQNAPSESRQRIDSILVATDFGISATAALERAIAVAERFDAKIDLVHVWSRSPHPVGGIALEIAGQPPRDVNRITQHNAELRLKELLEEQNGKSSRIDQSLLLEGDAAETIVDVANRGNYDLLMMGTRGRSGVARVITGSIAEKVLRRVACPVLLVPREAAKP